MRVALPSSSFLATHLCYCWSLLLLVAELRPRMGAAEIPRHILGRMEQAHAVHDLRSLGSAVGQQRLDAAEPGRAPYMRVNRPPVLLEGVRYLREAPSRCACCLQSASKLVTLHTYIDIDVKRRKNPPREALCVGRRFSPLGDAGHRSLVGARKAERGRSPHGDGIR